VELTEEVPELGTKLHFGEGKTWGGQIGVSTRVLFLLATDGLIVRGRPRGTWISGQYRWAPIETWLGGPLPTVGRGEAEAELLRRWLTAYGPATRNDVRWWTGWTMRRTDETLAAVGAVEVELEDGDAGYVSPEDADLIEDPEPWVRLLPALDPTTMGWKERDWYLGDHASMLFDGNGNAGPTIWANGRVVGGWTQKRDGVIVTEPLEHLDAATAKLLEQERRRLEAWFGGVRITPRFRSPLEKRLSG
jgi:hypothetical protein